jgi:hypothetical protein
VELHKANQNIKDLHEELKDIIHRRYHLSLQETTKVNAKQRNFLMKRETELNGQIRTQVNIYLFITEYVLVNIH